ncbi:MAG: serine/threonine-protein phosphatase [Herpetosiphon sp.]|nr:serine/threonine-protein phosphatase [Herpetosiphon sp.]
MGFFRKLFKRPTTVSEPPTTHQPEPPASPTNLADVETQPVTEPLDPEQLPEREPNGTSELTVEQLGTHELLTPPVLSRHVSTRGLAWWATRDLGRVRRNNEDSVYGMVMSIPEGEHDNVIGLFVVADGMGGHQGGEVASRRAIETVMVTVLEQLVLPAMSDEDPGNTLPLLMVSAVQEANARIWQDSQDNGMDMGTTCTAALLFGNGLYVAHVGDSRLYIATASGLTPITTDHSTVGRLIAMGQITEEESRQHPMRNQLYRTIGQHPDVQVDSLYQPLEGVSHLVLCSDGLWGMVADTEMNTILHESPWPQDACQRLIARANLAGGEDNISAIVVSLPALMGHGGTP